jgi:NADPH:quinone reductase-like Zn-dependent oxidoreductase
VAKRLGAGRVVGAGRDRASLATLPALGADATVALPAGPHSATTAALRPDAEALADAAADVDVVLDYLWGRPTTDAMTAILTARSDRSRVLDWIQIGSMAGPTIELPSAVLRSANLRLLGNGQGAVSTRAYLAELPSLIHEIDSGGIAVTTRTAPLADVETVWTAPELPGVRTVLIP